MVCTWREGYQSFPPRKSASLNAKNKSSSLLSNVYYHQLEIWVTSFSSWEEGTHKEGRFLHFLRTKDGSVGFHQLCSLLVSVSFFCTDHCYLAACRSLPGCCLFGGNAVHDCLYLLVLLLTSSRPPTSIGLEPRAAAYFLWTINSCHSSLSLASRKAPTAFQAQPWEKAFPYYTFKGLAEPRGGPMYWIQAWWSSLIILFSLRNKHHFLSQSSLFLEDAQSTRHMSTYPNPCSFNSCLLSYFSYP